MKSLGTKISRDAGVDWARKGRALDLFFAASKIASGILLPVNLIILVGVAAVLLLIPQRTRGIGLRIGVGAGCAFLALAVLPVGPVLLRTLERQFPSLETCPSLLDRPIAGIILLGGGVDAERIEGDVVDVLNDAADRVWMAAQLARQFPEASLVISGGQPVDNGTDRSEADATVGLLDALGVPREQMVIERASRTTAENAALSAPLIEKGDWVIVTSAFHMPRAIGTFRAAGLSVIAAPTDWRTGDSLQLLPPDPIENLADLTTATKEFLGLAGYWLTGRSTELLPGPGDHDCSKPPCGYGTMAQSQHPDGLDQQGPARAAIYN